MPVVRAIAPALPPSVPERKLAGHPELGRAVGGILATLRPGAVVLVGDYQLAAVLAFYVPGRPHPVCARFTGRRMNQYDLWDRLDGADAGCDAVFVQEIGPDDRGLPAGLAADFAITEVPQVLTIGQGGQTWRRFRLTVLRGFDGSLDSARPPSGAY
jgi:hypothetical protein